jgi:hypothetical protein
MRIKDMIARHRRSPRFIGPKDSLTDMAVPSPAIEARSGGARCDRTHERPASPAVIKCWRKRSAKRLLVDYLCPRDAVTGPRCRFARSISRYSSTT